MSFYEQRMAYFRHVVAYMGHQYPEETRAIQQGRNDGSMPRETAGADEATAKDGQGAH
jgi:hypothetical protein